jgi:hypothetical protein
MKNMYDYFHLEVWGAVSHNCFVWRIIMFDGIKRTEMGLFELARSVHNM